MSEKEIRITINSQTRGSGNNRKHSTPKPQNVAPPPQAPKDKK